MKRFAGFCLALPLLQVFAQQPQPKPAPPSAEEKRQIQSKTDELAAVVRKLRARHLNEDLLADLEVYEKAGRMALEFPDEFLAPSDTEHTLAILQTGLERGRQLESGQSPWTSGKGRRALGMYSALDGSVQPYGVTLPDSYDGATPARLYVWMHGRAA
ncbi:MAG TPA: hypothetical protein VL285_11975, partial [Bryobacteraceae bacterium]|nr:hypothetical protein [Bryobacteraceae bacterium]